MIGRNFFKSITVLVLLLICVLSAASFYSSNTTLNAEERYPIYVSFRFHLDSPVIREAGNTEPVRTSRVIKRLTEMLAELNVKAEYGFVAAVVQQLNDDYPETIELIKKMQLPVGYHGGSGHPEPAVVGRQQGGSRSPDAGVSLEEFWRYQWEYETHTLIPDWRFRSDGTIIRSNPKKGRPITFAELKEYKIFQKKEWLFGGWLAIQKILGVTPLQVDASGHGPVFEALGAGYEMSYGEIVVDSEGRGLTHEGVPTAIVLTELHEPHVFPNRPGIPPTYYGKVPGEDAPMMIGIKDYFKLAADNLPRYKRFQCGFLCHQGADYDIYFDLLKFLVENPENFKVVSWDPKGFQYKDENSPLKFYRETYGVNSLEEVLDIPIPLDKIKYFYENPKEKEWVSLRESDDVPQAKYAARLRSRELSLSQKTVLKAADYLLSHWPPFSHDGDFGAPPEFIDLDDIDLSLAETFQALTYMLNEYFSKGFFPDEVKIKNISGPIDFPTFELAKEPALDPNKVRTGYMPCELEQQYFPDPEIVYSQGLPPSGDYHIWIPTRTLVRTEDIISAIREVAKKMDDHIPGVIEIMIQSHDSRDKTPRMIRIKVNPAEFLYGLAQEYRRIFNKGEPGPVFLSSMKIAQSQVCKLVIPYTKPAAKGALIGEARFKGFIWRKKLTKNQLDTAWNYRPM